MAEAINKYPDELRADFQEYYSLNLDDIGVAYSVSHAACLCAQLPKTSRVFKAISPANEYDINTQLLAWLEYEYRLIHRSNDISADKVKPFLPEELLPEEMKKKKHVSMSIEEFDNFIKRKRKEVTDG